MRNCTDQEIIDYCRNTGYSRDVLDVFLTHFNRRINITICKKLIQCDIPARADTIHDIGLEIVDRLVNTDLLQKILLSEKPTAYFVSTVRNHTLDWLQKKRTNRNAPRIIAEQSTRSLSALISSEKERTLGDIIPAPKEAFDRNDAEEVNPIIAAVWDDIEKLQGNHRIILQATLMECRPLTPATINEIARQRQVTEDVIYREIKIIEEDLCRRRQLRKKKEEQATQLHAEILLLRTRLYAMRREQENDTDAILAQQEKIKKKEATRQRHLDDMNNSLRPTSKQIAGLLGLPEKQVQTINTLLSRVRTKLQTKYKKMLPQDWRT